VTAGVAGMVSPVGTGQAILMDLQEETARALETGTMNLNMLNIGPNNRVFGVYIRVARNFFPLQGLFICLE